MTAAASSKGSTVAVPTLTLAEMPQLDALFADMEPTDLAGQPFTPSLHPEDTFLLEDVPPEPEDDDEILSLGDARSWDRSSYLLDRRSRYH